jgi:hypothetical protein
LLIIKRHRLVEINYNAQYSRERSSGTLCSDSGTKDITCPVRRGEHANNKKTSYSNTVFENPAGTNTIENGSSRKEET